MTDGLRRLVVIRHAKSAYPDGVGDHDRPLNDRGLRDAPAIGRWLDMHLGWRLGGEPLVLVSSATRAQMTWSLASRELGDRWTLRVERTEPRIYEASTRTLRAVIDEVPDTVQTLVVVGHNPGLADLISEGAEEDDLWREATARFPTSAIAVLGTDLPWAAATARDGAFRMEDFAIARG